MKDRQFHIMGDPELDLIFTEAYRNTLRQVEKTERDREFRDHVEAMAELFERELSTRDLTVEERKEFVRAFKRQVEHAEQDLLERRAESRRLRRLGAMIFVSVLAVSGLFYVGTVKPFTSLDTITTELHEDLEKVRSGYGSYAEDYYRTLEKYRRRLGPERLREYGETMYGELDVQFEGLVERVEAGEIVYFDDAREYFPEKEDRKARRSRADSAMAKWIGRKVDESVDRVLEGAKDLIDKATD